MNANNAEALQPRTGKNAPSLKGIRVVVLLESLELGGIERQALLLARYLRDEGQADVEILVAQQTARVVELCEEYGIPWRLVTLPLPWSNSRLKQAARLLRFAWALRRVKADVILPYTSSVSAACGLVWRLTGARACIWNELGEKPPHVGGRPGQLAARWTPAFVVYSERNAGFLTQTLQVDRHKVRVVDRGIKLDPPEMDRPAWRAHLEVTADCFLACMVANPKSSNDHVTLLKAWRMVVDHLEPLGRKAVLVWAGRLDEGHDVLKALAYDLELFDSVRFPGEVKDISGLVNAVDLCVHSSANETSPSGVFECMAAGLPVTGTDSAGMREALGPAGYSLLTAPGNAEELADRIVKLAIDPALRSELGDANRQRIEAGFSQSRMCKDTLMLIANSLQQEG